jgi:hypothetical protein
MREAAAAWVQCRRRLGDDHADTLLAANDLGLLYRDDGELERAQLLLEWARDGRRRVLGQRHPETLVSVWAVGTVLSCYGRTTEAVHELADAARGLAAELGAQHPQAMQAAADLRQQQRLLAGRNHPLLPEPEEAPAREAAPPQQREGWGRAQGTVAQRAQPPPRAHTVGGGAEPAEPTANNTGLRSIEATSRSSSASYGSRSSQRTLESDAEADRRQQQILSRRSAVAVASAAAGLLLREGPADRTHKGSVQGVSSAADNPVVGDPADVAHRGGAADRQPRFGLRRQAPPLVSEAASEQEGRDPPVAVDRRASAPISAPETADVEAERQVHASTRQQTLDSERMAMELQSGSSGAQQHMQAALSSERAKAVESEPTSASVTSSWPTTDDGMIRIISASV